MPRKRLSKKAIDLMPFSTVKNPNKLGDTEVRCLHVYAGRTTKTFYLIIQVNGKRHIIRLGNINELSLTDARNLAIKTESEIRNDNFLHQSNMLIEKACIDLLVPYYKNFVKDKNPTGIIKNFIIPQFGHFKITKLTAMDVQKAVYKLIEEGYAAETIRKRILIGKKLYKILIKHRLVIFNPFNDADLPIVENIRNVTLKPEQYLDFVECCLAINTVFSDCILFMLFTGLRVSEAIRIKVHDVSSDRSTLMLDKTKSGVAQSVPLNTAAQEIYQRRIQLTCNEFLFDSPVKTYTHISSPRGCFKQVQVDMHARGYDIFNMVLHDLRRSFGTQAYRSTGGDLHLIMKLLRHKNLSILQRYVHPHQNDIIAASEAIGQSFLALPKQTNEQGS